MRYALIAIIFGIVCAASSPASPQPSDELRSNLIKSMNILPGSYNGWVPGAYLTPEMKPVSDAFLVSVPVVDVDKNCNNERRCVQSEQNAYDTVKYEWDQISIISKNVCYVSAFHQSTGVNAVAFYKRLRGCVELRLSTVQTIEDLSARSFKP